MVNNYCDHAFDVVFWLWLATFITKLKTDI